MLAELYDGSAVLFHFLAAIEECGFRVVLRKEEGDWSVWECSNHSSGPVSCPGRPGRPGRVELTAKVAHGAHFAEEESAISDEAPGVLSGEMISEPASHFARRVDR